MCRYIQKLVRDDNTRDGERRARGHGRGRGRGKFRGRHGRYGNSRTDQQEDQEHGSRDEGNCEEEKVVKLESEGGEREKRDGGCGEKTEGVTGDMIEGGDDGAICEGLVEAILADVAVQEAVSGGEGGDVTLVLGGGDGCSEEVGTSVSHGTRRKEGEVSTEAEDGGDCGKEHLTCVSRGKGRGRGVRKERGGRGVRKERGGRRKMEGEEWVGRREAKRRKIQSVKLQDIPAQKPTLLEKVH